MLPNPDYVQSDNLTAGMSYTHSSHLKFVKCEVIILFKKGSSSQRKQAKLFIKHISTNLGKFQSLQEAVGRVSSAFSESIHHSVNLMQLFLT